MNGAAIGERNDSLFKAACQMRDKGKTQHEIQTELMSRALADGLDPTEVNKTLVSVFKRPPREAAAKQDGRKPKRPTLRNRTPVTYKTAPKGDYKLKKRRLPEPLEDGARVLLNTAFEEGENVNIVIASTNEEGELGPNGKGTTRSREWWLKKLDEGGGHLDGMANGRGVFVRINPLTLGGCEDKDVTKFRHVLIEADDLDLEEQWHLINETNLPCAAVMSSGGRSLHAWVKVDAKDAASWGQRTKMIYDHLAGYIDPKNINPSRLSRLPNTRRGGSRQELLALNIGATSWKEWESEIEAEGIGELLDFTALAKFDTANDPATVLGNRWLCKGGSCLIVGQSGIGKSSLSMQLAMNWALGRTSFGIAPKRPLKSLIIQAENDFGDVAEMVQGCLKGMEIKAGDDAFAALHENLVLMTEPVLTGEAFTVAVRHLIGAHKPDLVWIDPLLSFIGDDISRQDVCSYFFRNLLNPISFESGICWMLMHHTNKPSADPKSKSGWSSIDYSYSGTGSSELTNWARAVCFLRSTKDEGRFELALNKRGPRAKATHLEGDRTTVIHLKHSDDSILWEQIPKPVLVVKTPKEKKKRPEKTIGDMDGLIEKIIVPMKKSQVVRFAVDGGHGSYYVANKDWHKIEKRLFKNENGLFLNYDPNNPKPTTGTN